MIDLHQVEEALNFLSDTDEQAGQMKRAVEAHDYLADKEQSIAFLAAQGTVAERNHLASLSEKVIDQRTKWLDAIGESAALENKRKTAQLRVGVWQSIQKARHS